MCPLPDGVVDIPAVMQLLKERGFSGPIVVEQDLASDSPVSAMELARRNLASLGDLA
jgi:inosose dehydratase